MKIQTIDKLTGCFIIKKTIMDATFLSYIIFCLLMSISPGPDMVLATKNTIVHSKKGGLITVLGASTSLVIYAILAASGLTFLIKTNSTIYMLIKYTGAGYLFFLGAHTLYLAIQRAKSPLAFEGSVCPEVQLKKLYIQGIFTNLLNPKIMLLYISVLPQFIPESADFLVVMEYASIQIGMAISWLCIYVLVIHKLREAFLKLKVTQWIETITGVAFVAISCKILFFE